MIRKSLFWGLTLVLVVALVSLIYKGRQLEKQEAGKPVEIVQQSRPSLTRVLNPQDLVIVNSTMQRESPGVVSHSVEIRNNGNVGYGRIQLRFNYQSRGGKILASRTQSILKPVAARSSVRVSDLTIEGVPASAVKSGVTILFAEIGVAPTENKLTFSEHHY